MHFAKLMGAAAFVAVATLSTAAAQDWPSKPIRIIVPYAPGGTDLQIRAMAPTLQRILGQPLVIENKAGGGASLGTSFVKSAPPDGYTVLYTGTGALTVVPNVQKHSYLLDDFIAIGNVTGTPFVVAASPAAPFRSVKEMVAYARANPGKATFGSAGSGTTTHMAGEAMAAAAGVKLLHVPYQGIGPAVTSILGGNIHMVVGLPSAIMPQVAAGKLIALAITGPEQIELLKGIGTLRESSIDMTDVTKFGMLVPKGTPAPVVQKLGAALREASAAPAFIESMRKGYTNVMYMDGPTFRRVMDAENAHFKKLIGELGLAEKS
jgi:tripartite-type tricarboxylate transporter receptor subunit TctC